MTTQASPSAADGIRTAGLAAPIADAQRVFRAVLDALSRPTLAQPLVVDLAPPAPLGATAGAIVLALCDADTPVWLDAPLHVGGAVEAWIGFHAGARVVDDPRAAHFVVASSPATAPALDALDAGTDEEPHRSATLVIDAAHAEPIAELVATGPGVDGTEAWDGRGLSPALLAAWPENVAGFPRGIDVVLAEAGAVRGLPRTTTLTEVR